MEQAALALPEFDSTAPVDLLAAAVSAHPKTTALVDADTGQEITWTQLEEQTSALAETLEEAGVGPGARVAVVLPAGSQFAAALHASIRLGAALVPLSPREATPMLAAQLRDSRPAALLSASPSSPAARAAGALGIPQLDAAAAGDATAAKSHGAQRRGLSPAEDMAIVYTSGTTGSPKGVRQTLGNHLASALGCQASLGTEPGEPWLLALSPHHVGGLAILVRGLISAQPVICLPSFSETMVQRALAAHRPRLVSLVPAQLRRLLAAGSLEELRQCRAILLGGGPAAESEVTGWVEAGLAVCPSYGLTETCSQICSVAPGRAQEMAGTVGPPHPFVRLEILSEEGGDGQIRVSGEVLSPGYLDPAANPATSRTGFATGDLGEITPEGWLRVTGRLDDTILSGGENVNPIEVEQVLAAHPGVRDVGVVGIHDPVYGLRVAAVVVGDVDAEQLRLWALGHLPAFKIPRSWARAERLPRTDSGKLIRGELRHWFES